VTKQVIAELPEATKKSRPQWSAFSDFIDRFD